MPFNSSVLQFLTYVCLWPQVVPGVQQQSDSRRSRGSDQGFPGCRGSVYSRVPVARPCCSLQSFRPCLLHCLAQRDQGECSTGRRHEDGPEQQAVFTPLQLGRFETFFQQFAMLPRHRKKKEPNGVYHFLSLGYMLIGNDVKLNSPSSLIGQALAEILQYPDRARDALRVLLHLVRWDLALHAKSLEQRH